MPFGLTNAPTMFMTLMHSVLRLYFGKFVMVFLDSLVIYSKSTNEQSEHLCMMFDKLRGYALYDK